MRRQEHVQHLVTQERQRIGDRETYRELEAPALHRPMLHRRLAHRKIRVPLHEPGRRVLCRRGDTMRSHRTGIALLAALLLAFSLPGLAAAAPEGTMTWGLHVTLASRWLDPAETEALVTPFMVLYAIHDAVVKPMTGAVTGPSLAESWTMSRDGLVYEFVLRKNARFHNGEPVTADDVKFSFERYHGAAAKLLKERVKEIQTPDPLRVRIMLKEPWPDFMTFYGTTASGAAWVVPRKYVEKVGEEGFKRAPIGAGPYRLVSFTPGVELVLEAFDGYWRKTPAVKRLVFRSITDETTRAAAVKRGEVDLIYLVSGPVAEDLKKTPGFKVASPLPSLGQFWLDFPEQGNPKSPWHDQRVRLAARQHRAQGPRVRPGAAAASLRSREGQGPPRGGGLSQRLRRGRLHALPALLLHGRGGGELSPGGRHPHPREDHGACGVPHRVAGAEDSRRDPGAGGAVGECGHAPRALRHP